MAREEMVRNLLTELIDMIDNGSQRDLDRADEIGTSIIKLVEQESTTKNDLGVDAISRQEAIETIRQLYLDLASQKAVIDILKVLPSITPQPKCKDCKWWKDSDGVYRRGVGAESKCPINNVSVNHGFGYCYMFEPQERSDKE